jgi:hypothetical protein
MRGIIGKLRETFCLRIVSSVTELQEKRFQFEQGSMIQSQTYKTILLRGLLKEQPEYRLKQALADGDRRQETVFLTMRTQSLSAIGFDEGMYRSLEEMFLDKIAPFHDNYFSVVNLPLGTSFFGWRLIGKARNIKKGCSKMKDCCSPCGNRNAYNETLLPNDHSLIVL